jgi:ubiquinone/menaquinone biosynthesis C-methylase UbiE
VLFITLDCIVSDIIQGSIGRSMGGVFQCVVCIGSIITFQEGLPMDRKQHWDQVYTTKPSDSVSWFQANARQSLQLIKSTGLGKNAAIIDVGSGASTLVNDLVSEGYTDLTVLDISSAALAVAKQHLGKRVNAVQWMESDVTSAEFSEHRFDIWHDRAVFHFLTDPADRHAYVERVIRSVRPGGHVIVATFAADGPEKCSGLATLRYTPEDLHKEFGDGFLLVEYRKEAHQTPSGTLQQFVYCHFRKDES